MTTNSKASLALILGSLAGLMTMGLHPTGREVADGLAAGGGASLNQFAHSLGLIGQPLLLAGTLALTVRLATQRDTAIAAFILFAWASAAVMMATVASGFIATDVIREGASHHAAPGSVESALHYTRLLNQAFAMVYVAFSALAILLWSWAMLRSAVFPRSLGIYGCIVGAACLAGTLSGRLSLDIHGFGLVVVSQSVWYVWSALILRRMP